MLPHEESGMPRILVAEDDKCLREVLVFAFSDEGFAVTAAKDGRHALELLQDRQVDIILSDYVMPRMCGLSFYKAVRRQDETVPFILYSSCADLPELPEGLRLLRKPLPLAEIIEAVRELLPPQTDRL